MSRDRLAQMQAEKRRAQGYAPSQPGAPGSPTSGATDAAMYPVGGAAQGGSPPMQQISPSGAAGGATFGATPQSAVDPSRAALLGNRGQQQQPSYTGQAAPMAAPGAGMPPQQQGGAYGVPGQQQPGYGAPGQQQGGYEMQQMQGAPVAAGAAAYGNGAPSAGPGSSMQEFFGEIDLISNSLQQLKNNITQINTLHTTVLNSATNEQRQEQASRDLEQLTAETSRLTNSTKLRIKNLSELNDKQANVIQPGELNTRRMQVAAQKKKFMDLIQEYREVEAKSRDKYRQRMERQYKIVKPDATPEEIKYAMETDQGSQVFANALTQSTRYADARNAYREVQERHEDIKRIAQTMQELQQLFNDMAMLVERQDEQIQTIEATANDVETNMAAANVQIDKGVVKARKARRKRWICFWILVIIIIVVVLAVTLSILHNQGKL